MTNASEKGQGIGSSHAQQIEGTAIGWDLCDLSWYSRRLFLIDVGLRMYYIAFFSMDSGWRF